MAGLSARAHIVRDPFGIPHIDAANLIDAYRALGFAHAQDRLWQMEVLRRSARGQLAELVGPRALDSDRLARTLGFGAAADREEKDLSRDTRAALDAYAAGVNAWLAEIAAARAPRPFELRWLEFEPGAVARRRTRWRSRGCARGTSAARSARACCSIGSSRELGRRPVARLLPGAAERRRARSAGAAARAGPRGGRARRDGRARRPRRQPRLRRAGRALARAGSPCSRTTRTSTSARPPCSTWRICARAASSSRARPGRACPSSS